MANLLIFILGTKVTDEAIRQMIQNLPLIERIDLSECPLITDSGIAALAISKADRLVGLNLSHCSKITDASLKLLKNCKTLERLDMRHCESISLEACERFLRSGDSNSTPTTGDTSGHSSNSNGTVSSPSKPSNGHGSPLSESPPGIGGKLVNHKKKILHSCRDWQMTEERFFVKKLQT